MKTKAVRKYIEPGPFCLKFQLDLHNVNLLLTPIARGLDTLEGHSDISELKCCSHALANPLLMVY